MVFEVSGITGSKETGIVWTLSLTCRFILYLGNVVPIDSGFREVEGRKGAGFKAEEPGQGVLCQMTFVCSEAAPAQGCAER